MEATTKRRAMLAAGTAMVLALGNPATATARDTLVCTWGGTPAVTTGTLKIKPGLTFTPSAGPLKFIATGELAGDGCDGTMTFDGTIAEGGTCAHVWFEGRVKGVPGVARFEGPGIGVVVHEFLYDEDGNIVGADQPQVLSGATMGGGELSDCNTDTGFTDGHFSSIVEFWG